MALGEGSTEAHTPMAWGLFRVMDIFLTPPYLVALYFVLVFQKHLLVKTVTEEKT